MYMYRQASRRGSDGCGGVGVGGGREHFKQRHNHWSEAQEANVYILGLTGTREHVASDEVAFVLQILFALSFHFRRVLSYSVLHNCLRTIVR